MLGKGIASAEGNHEKKTPLPLTTDSKYICILITVNTEQFRGLTTFYKEAFKNNMGKRKKKNAGK